MKHYPDEEHRFMTLREPRPPWVRQVYGAVPVCACDRCKQIFAGSGPMWVGPCIPIHQGAA